MLFKLGQIVATPGAMALATENGVSLVDLVRRHVNGDWGDLDNEDKAANVQAMGRVLRIVSSYRLNLAGDKIWVITEADRSSTCCLLPDEY